ncbi:MAG: response regulator [Burkholderiaceae bacterium]|nr:response regulator [Burkholderiaceae bacterium]
MARDITERHTAEQQRLALEAQLREAQKMESLGTLAGGVAHDFNNVLGAILGHAVLAQTDLPAGHPARAGLEQIRRSGLRARDLVQQILAFSRRQPQQRVTQPLRPLVEESLALLRATLPARVHLQARLHDAPLQVAVDGTQMQQVLMNLCTNAWHALGDAGGNVEVGLDAVAPAASGDDAHDDDAAAIESPGWAHLWVRDNGPGMSPATLARIFEPFFTTKAPGQGTGLGLSVVHGIVRAHEGRIRVDTAPGQGATFHVYLPLQTRQDTQPGALLPLEPEPNASVVPATADALQGHGRHVLYVDDDDVMATMVDQLLRRDGWRVTVRGGVAEALSLFRTDPAAFDAVVTDYSMPDGTGLDLASAMKLLRPDLPVIVSTGYVSEQLTAGMAAAGVRRVLRKERTLEELPQQLHELLPAEPAV